MNLLSDLLYLSPDADAGSGAPETPEQPTADGGGNGDGGQSTFTQTDLNRITAERAERARSALLKELGFESADAAKKQLPELRQLRESQMSDLERANSRVAELETAVSDREQLAKRVEAQDAVLADLVKQRMKELSVPKHVVTLLDGKTAVEQLAYLNANADAFGQAAVPSTDASKRGGGKPVPLEERIKTKRANGRYGGL